jgi:hypothetical protein
LVSQEARRFRVLRQKLARVRPAGLEPATLCLEVRMPTHYQALMGILLNKCENDTIQPYTSLIKDIIAFYRSRIVHTCP